MLALILLGCNGPTRERLVCAPEVQGYLYIRAYHALAAAPDEAADCVRTGRVRQGYAGYDAVPLDPSATLAAFRSGDEAPYTLAGLVDGFPEVGVGPDATRIVYEFGTRHSEVFPTSEQLLQLEEEPDLYDGPVLVDDGLVSSVVTPLGVEVTGRAGGLVAEVPGSEGVELVVRCSDCEIYVPYAPSRLTVELEHASLHLCAGNGRLGPSRLLDTVLHVQGQGSPERWAFRIDEALEVSGSAADLPAQLADLESNMVTGAPLCTR